MYSDTRNCALRRLVHQRSGTHHFGREGTKCSSMPLPAKARPQITDSRRMFPREPEPDEGLVVGVRAVGIEQDRFRRDSGPLQQVRAPVQLEQLGRGDHVFHAGHDEGPDQPLAEDLRRLQLAIAGAAPENERGIGAHGRLAGRGHAVCLARDRSPAVSPAYQ